MVAPLSLVGLATAWLWEIRRSTNAELARSVAAPDAARGVWPSAFDGKFRLRWHRGRFCKSYRSCVICGFLRDTWSCWICRCVCSQDFRWSGFGKSGNALRDREKESLQVAFPPSCSSLRSMELRTLRCSISRLNHHKGLRLDRPIFNVNAELPSGPVPFYLSTEPGGTCARRFSGHGSVAGGAVKVGYDCDEVAPLKDPAAGCGSVPQEKLQTQPLVKSSIPSGRQIASASSSVDLKSPTVLLVNSNWNEHWKVDHGNVIKVAGQLASRPGWLAASRHTLHIRYAPRSFAVGRC